MSVAPTSTIICFAAASMRPHVFAPFSIFLLLSPSFASPTGPPCPSIVACGETLLASGYAVVNLAEELASINDYFEQLPRDVSTVHFLYRMIAFKDEELSRIVSISTFLLGRLRPPHEQAQFIEHTIFEARLRQLHDVLRYADAISSTLVNVEVIADELLLAIQGVVTSEPPDTPNYMAYSSEQEMIRRETQGWFGAEDEFERLLSQLMEARGDPSRQSEFAEIAHALVQGFEEGRYHGRMELDLVVIDASAASNETESGDEYEDDEAQDQREEQATDDGNVLDLGVVRRDGDAYRATQVNQQQQQQQQQLHQAGAQKQAQHSAQQRDLHLQAEQRARSAQHQVQETKSHQHQHTQAGQAQAQQVQQQQQPQVAATRRRGVKQNTTRPLTRRRKERG